MKAEGLRGGREEASELGRRQKRRRKDESEDVAWAMLPADGRLVPSFHERERARADELERRAVAADAEVARLRALLKQAENDRPSEGR